MATARQVRVAASIAILPATDQTRTTGLGASVLDATRLQLIALAAILLVGVIVSVAVGRVLSRPATIRTEPPAV